MLTGAPFKGWPAVSICLMSTLRQGGKSAHVRATSASHLAGTFSTHSRQSEEGDGKHRETGCDGLSDPRLWHLVSVSNGGHGNLWQEHEEDDNVSRTKKRVFTRLSTESTHYITLDDDCSNTAQFHLKLWSSSVNFDVDDMLMDSQSNQKVVTQFLTVQQEVGQWWKKLESN